MSKATFRTNVYYTGRFSASGIDGIDGTTVVSSVDRANSDGTGVAVLDCESGCNVIDELNEMESVESFDIR